MTPTPTPRLAIAQMQMHWTIEANMASILRAYVIQANWPNALNRPEESRNTGHSAVISPSGELVFRLPMEASGVAVFTLGERSCEWHAA